MRKKTVASRFRKSLSCTVDGVGLRFRSVWCIHTKVSQACIYIYIYMKPSCNFGCCWSLLSNLFFPPPKRTAILFVGILGWKLLWCHDTCSSPWWPEAQPLDGGGFAGLQRFPIKSHGLPLNNENWWQNSFISNVELWENRDFGTSSREKSLGTNQSLKVCCSHGTTRTSLTPWEVLWLLIGFDHDPHGDTNVVA